MNKKQLKMGTILLIFVFSLIPTIFPWGRSGAWTDGYSVIWFVVLYLIGACLQTCAWDELAIIRWDIIFVFLVVIHTLIRLIIGYASLKLLGKVTGVGIFTSYNSLLVLFASIALFLFFKQFQLGNGRCAKIAVTLGKLCFGAYLCSDHALMRGFLWKTCDLAGRASSILGRVIYVCIIVLTIFVAGCLIEGVRIKLMQITGIERLIQKVDVWFEHFNVNFFDKDILG